MGRASGRTAAFSNGGFDAVFGARRGGPRLDPWDPAASDSEAERARQQLLSDVYAERWERPSLELLRLEREGLAGEHVDELHAAFTTGWAARAMDRDEALGAEVRQRLEAIGLHDAWYARRLASRDGELHVIRGMDGDLRNTIEATTRCGLTVTHLNFAVRRGAWTEPTFRLGTQSWSYAQGRCRACSAGHTEPEMDERPDRLHYFQGLADRPLLEATQARLRPLMDSAFSQAKKRSEPPTERALLIRARRAMRDAAMGVAADVVHDDPTGAVMRMGGARADRAGAFVEEITPSVAMQDRDAALTVDDWREVLQAVLDSKAKAAEQRVAALNSAVMARS